VIRKQNNLFIRVLLVAAGLVILIIIFWFRQSLVDSVWGAYIRYFNYSEKLANGLGQSEKEELERLRVENETLKNNIADLKEEINLIEDGLEPTYIKMLGGVVGESAADYYGSFYVTYPKDKTVYRGMNVYTSGNVLVGTVEEVLKTSLFVTRLGQNKTFLAESAEVDEQLELSSLGSGLYMGSIAAGSKISVGDQIYLKGYPRAVVGMVGEIVKNEGTLSTVYVRAPYDIYKKEIFYVLQ
jgi:cell shape-determining protein MreC